MLGRIVIVGLGAGAEVSLVLRQLMARRASMRGTMLRARPLEQKAQAVRAFEREVAAAPRERPAAARDRPVVPVRARDRGVRAPGGERQARQGAAALRVSDHRRHPMRVLTRLEGRVPALHALLTRSHARRFDALAPKWDTIRSDVGDSRRMLEQRARRARPDGARARARRRHRHRAGRGHPRSGASRARRSTRSTRPAQMIELRARQARAERRALRRRRRRAPAVRRTASFDLAVSLLVQPFEPSCIACSRPGGWALFCYPMGPGTPIWFPTALVAPRLERAGFAEVRSGAVGPGEWTAGPALSELETWASRAREAPARRWCPWSGTEGDWRPRAPGSPDGRAVVGQHAAECASARKG